MKKFLFWTALASVALTGCVKNDVEPNPSLGQDVEITFNQPVVGKVTKAAPQPGVLESLYNIDEDFVVTAWSHKEFFKDETTPAVYFHQILADWKATGNNNPYTDNSDKGYRDGGWALTPTYYWPKTHYLTFSAFSPAALIDGTIIDGTSDKYADGAETTLDNGITITNVRTPNVITKHYDLLYSNRVYDQKERVYTHDNDYYYGVDVLFNHAFASVNVKVKWDKNYGGTNKIVINNIWFENVASKATFNENVGGNRELVNNDKLTGRDKATWTLSTPIEKIASISIKGGESDVTLTEDTQTFGIPALFIPQDLETTKPTLRVQYTITNADGDGDGYGDATLTEEIQFDLSKIQLTDDIDSNYKWKIGRKYTYTLTFTLNEILLAPSVEGWDDASASLDSDDLI